MPAISICGSALLIIKISTQLISCLVRISLILERDLQRRSRCAPLPVTGRHFRGGRSRQIIRSIVTTVNTTATITTTTTTTTTTSTTTAAASTPTSTSTAVVNGQTNAEPCTTTFIAGGSQSVMSMDRNNSRPLKPTLASARTARSPLTPRIAGNATAPTPVVRSSAPRPPSTRTPLVSPRVKSQNDTAGSLNVTPRSTARKSRAVISPSQEDEPSDAGTKSSLGNESLGKLSDPGGLSVVNYDTSQSAQRAGQPKSNRASDSSPPMRSHGPFDLPHSSAQASKESRFFHASDMPKQEPTLKRPEAKKIPSFFYADGREDRPAQPLKPSSPVFSGVSDKSSSGPWNNPTPNPSKYPPMLSPALAATTSSAPFFASSSQAPLRSPSPSKENIHLSYRKGASQIFGMRPTPPSTSSSVQGLPRISQDEIHESNLVPSHRKSPSMSSIDSGLSRQSRRRSATSVDQTASVSPLTHEIKAATLPLVASPPGNLRTIDTSLASSAVISSPSTLSPTKHASELAADARRERKVLDLEISNNSLLAINASLEREVRKQKAELKRFRRLSRAGYLSMNTKDLPRRNSRELHALEEGNESEDDPFGDGDYQDDLSDSEDGSLLSGGDSLPSDAQAIRDHDRLAKDEKRLRIDLERHKELLVQSQAMNQSIKRCMYATAEMIREGKNALEYHVCVNDVKLGGRILTEHDDEIVDGDAYTNIGDDSMEGAKGLLDVWYGVGLGEGSEGSGDRDSGIEVDKTVLAVSNQPRLRTASVLLEDSGRPPGDIPETIG